jgi:hypothetical protein
MHRMRALGLALAATLVPAATWAQTTNFATSPGVAGSTTPGWTFTPGVAVGTGWDDNVLVRGSANQTPNDVLNTISPQAALDYNGRRGQLVATYDGAFLLYRTLDQLDSYDQRSTLYGRRLLTKHTAFFVRNTMALVPTTELAEFVAVPFVRTGSFLEDVRSGIDAAFTKYTTLSATYDFQYINFNHDVPGTTLLQGGYSNGATAALRHLLNARLAVTFDYQYQHAALHTNQTFDISNSGLGLDYKVSELTHVYGAAGISRLAVTEFSTNRTGPAFSAGLQHTLGSTIIDVHYGRSFVPSYGFGGTMQNEEAIVRARFPIARRVVGVSGLSWRRDEPLTPGALALRSYWVEGSVAYLASPWIRIEGYFAGTHQTIQRADGTLDRNRAGIQVVAAKPMRIQ